MLLSYLMMVARCPMIVRLPNWCRENDRALVSPWRRHQRGDGVCGRADMECRRCRALLLLLETGVVMVAAPVILLVEEVLLLVVMVKPCRTMHHSLVNPRLHHMVI
jgi:hypothetical protein